MEATSRFSNLLEVVGLLEALNFSFLLWLYNPLNLGSFFSFLILYTVGTTPWTEDQPVARPLPTQRTTQTQNKRTQTSTPRVGFETTKTVHTLDRAATVIGFKNYTSKNVYAF
jgi:hypothetical protein